MKELLQIIGCQLVNAPERVGGKSRHGASAL
jgi:hypothetical protein